MQAASVVLMLCAALAAPARGELVESRAAVRVPRALNPTLVGTVRRALVEPPTSRPGFDRLTPNGSSNSNSGGNGNDSGNADGSNYSNDSACRKHYSTALETATQRAVDKLVANQEFKFSALQTGWIGFGLGGPRRDGWRSVRSFGRAFIPLQSPAQAIEGLYTGSFRAECGVGRQVAQYATLYELFGAQGFDTAFANNEIVIGTFNQLNVSDSVLLGRSAGEFTRDGRAVQASRSGEFVGLPGFIFHVFDRSTLDDIHNQAENFVVYDLSDAARAALREHGGFEHYNRINRELWELSVPLDLTAHRIFERLLYERDDALLAAIAPRKRATIERMRALLGDPFYRGFLVYVHPKGVKPVGYHFARLLDRNPRTPFRIELGLHNLHTTIYRRWQAQRGGDCLGR
jgi:hypothetical protein